MLKPEKESSSGYIYDPREFTEVYFFGDFLRKSSHLLHDSEEKWKIVSRAESIQSTEWPSLESYHATLKSLEKELCDHIGTHSDPFILK